MTTTCHDHRAVGFHAQRGFTLVELIISIAILAITVGAVIAAIDPAEQARLSRDARRKSDLQLIQTALELYNQDNNQYVDSTAFTRITGIDAGFSTVLESGGYIKSVPADPKYDSGVTCSNPTTACMSAGKYTAFNYFYRTEASSSSQDFILVATLEAADNNTNSPCTGLGAILIGSVCTEAACIDYCYGVENSF